jgi:Helix-turn-helix.
MPNFKIRQQLLLNGIKNYQLADAVGINQSTLSVWLRTELSDERKERVEKALDKLIQSE